MIYSLKIANIHILCILFSEKLAAVLPKSYSARVRRVSSRRTVPFSVRCPSIPVIFVALCPNSVTLGHDGPFKKKIKTVSRSFSPFSLLGAFDSSSSRRLGEGGSSVVVARPRFGVAPADLPRRHGGRSVVDAGAAPVDVEVKVCRSQRGLDLGRIHQCCLDSRRIQAG